MTSTIKITWENGRTVEVSASIASGDDERAALNLLNNAVAKMKDT